MVCLENTDYLVWLVKIQIIWLGWLKYRLFGLFRKYRLFGLVYKIRLFDLFGKIRDYLVWFVKLPITWFGLVWNKIKLAGR